MDRLLFLVCLRLNKRLINSLRPRQDGRHFADDIFMCIFFNENCCILIKFSLKYVRKGPIDSNPALVEIMAWRRSGDKPYINQWWLVYRRIYASLGLNELNNREADDLIRHRAYYDVIVMEERFISVFIIYGIYQGFCTQFARCHGVYILILPTFRLFVHSLLRL